MTHPQSSPSLPDALVAAPGVPGMRPALFALLGAWLLISFVLGAEGAFVGRGGAPPWSLVAAVLLPIALFAAAYLASAKFRAIILAADLPLLAATHAWRFAGAGFLALALLGLLPGYFAWPAGLGDMLAGVTAPWVAMRLLRDPRYARSTAFMAWNTFGIFDFAVLAVGTGTLAPVLFPKLLDTVTPQMIAASPMRHLPLSMVPAFLVPLFTIFHLIAFLKAKNSR